MRGFAQPRVARPWAWWLVWPLAFVLSAARGFAGGAASNSEFLQFDDETTRRIGAIEAARAQLKPPPDLPTVALSEGERVREGNAAVADALAQAGVKGAIPPDIETEYREILDAEVRALGRQADLLVPDDDPVDDVPDPVLAPVSHRLTQQVRAGIDEMKYTPTGASAVTTDATYSEYRFVFEDKPAEKTQVKVDGSLYGSTTRESGITSFDFHDRFDRHSEGQIGGTAIVERWAQTFSREDSVLGSAFGAYLIHFPEQLDFTARYTLTHRILDQESQDLDSTKNQQTEVKLEKRMHGGTARLVYQAHQLDVPSDQSLQRDDHVVLGGYTAPIMRKVDVDYAYIYRDEKINVASPQTGAFKQSNNQINILVRFSHAMSMSFDVDTEFRTYRSPDTTFPSFERTLLSPTFTVIQTPHFTYNFGYATELYYHRPPLPAFENFNEKLNDYHVERYFVGGSYQKKRLSALGSFTYSPTRYASPGILQAQSMMLTEVLTVLYNFDECTRFSASYNRVNQEFDTLPSNNHSENVTVDISRRF